MKFFISVLTCSSPSHGGFGNSFANFSHPSYSRCSCWTFCSYSLPPVSALLLSLSAGIPQPATTSCSFVCFNSYTLVPFVFSMSVTLSRFFLPRYPGCYRLQDSCLQPKLACRSLLIHSATRVPASYIALLMSVQAYISSISSHGGHHPFRCSTK